MTDEQLKLADKLDAIFDRIEVSCNWHISSEEREDIAKAALSLRAAARPVPMTENELTVLVTKARGEFVELGQEPLDGCSMERFIARKLRAALSISPAPTEAVSIENEQLRKTIQLHAGDAMSLSNELDEWRERALAAEAELASRYIAQAPTGTGGEVSQKVIDEGYSDWSWNKKGEPVGRMLAHEAARVSFHAGARFALALPPPQAPDAVRALRTSEKMLLEWIQKNDGQYGECQGETLDELMRLGLVMVQGVQSGLENDFIAKGSDIMYRAVSITDAGRAALAPPDAGRRG